MVLAIFSVNFVFGTVLGFSSSWSVSHNVHMYVRTYIFPLIPFVHAWEVYWCTRQPTCKALKTRSCVGLHTGWFHVKTRRKKINVKELHFYEEIWKKIGYLYGFCHFWHQFGFCDRFWFFFLNSQKRTLFKKWILKSNIFYLIWCHRT